MNRDLVDKPIQSILQCKSRVVMSCYKVTCVTATGFRRELVSNSMQISTILAALELF